MVSPQQGLKGLTGTIGIFFGALLLSAFVGAATAQTSDGLLAQPSSDACTFACDTSGNTAGGNRVLQNNTGTHNTGFGDSALSHNTTGFENTASGFEALYSNTIGACNTASGWDTLHSNTTGYFNTASGWAALSRNTTGYENMASGAFALNQNTTGYENMASGLAALDQNTTGDSNTASGFDALVFNTTGSFNIGLGYLAGFNIEHGSNDIEIWVNPTPGFLPPLGDESNTIRIGIQGTQKKTFIAGISGTPVVGADVTVNGNGQLGVLPSSARYKRDIHDMGGASAGLMKLRPVSFRYKDDPSGTLQYGLVAEEVERVYPELVVHGTDGKVQSVRYLELTALLLNELQKQTRHMQTQASQLREQASQLQKQSSETQELAQRLATKDRQLAVQQREIDALKQKDASINALSQRLAALEQQVRTATPQRLRSLASK
jgi:Chaperone of endosialidase